MTFQCKYEAQDYVQAYPMQTGVPADGLPASPWAMAVLLLLAAAFGSFGPKTRGVSALPMFLVAAFWLYCATGLWRRAGQRAFSGRPELAQAYQVEVSDSGIVFDGPISSSRWTWPAFVKFIESKDVFLAFLSPCTFVIFPKRLLAPGQPDQLRELLRQKLPPK